MLAGLFYALYMIIIGSIAAALFVAVDWLEANRLYAFVLKFLILGFGAAAIFETNRSQNGISKLDPGGAPRRVRFGEVGHKSATLSLYSLLRNRLRTPHVRMPRGKRKSDCSNP